MSELPELRVVKDFLVEMREDPALAPEIVRFFREAEERGDMYPTLPVPDERYGYRYDMGREAGWSETARWRWRANTWVALVLGRDR